MRGSIIKIFVCFLAVWATLAVAQTPTPLPTPQARVLTLEESIRMALASFPSIEAAKYDTQILAGKVAEAKSAYFLPELKLRVIGGPVPDVPPGNGPPGFPRFDNNLSELGPFIQARVDAIQPLFTFGKLSGAKEAAERGYQLKIAQERMVRDQVVMRVKEVYYGLTYLYSMQDFVNDLTDLVHKARDRAVDQIKKHSADITDIDLMRLDVFDAEVERRKVEAENAIDWARATLRLLVGYKTGPVDIADHNERYQEVEIKALDYYLDRARVSRPEIRQLNEGVAAKRALLKVSKADFFPMFFLGGYYNYGKAPDRTSFDNPYLKDDFNMNTGGVAVGMEQKLSFFLTNSRYEQAAADYNKVMADRAQVLIGIETEVRKAYADTITRRDTVNAALKGFRAGRSWVTASMLSFGFGTVPVKDVLEAFVGYTKVKVTYLDTLHDHVVALASLSRSVGEEVTTLQY